MKIINPPKTNQLRRNTAIPSKKYCPYIRQFNRDNISIWIQLTFLRTEEGKNSPVKQLIFKISKTLFLCDYSANTGIICFPQI